MQDWTGQAILIAAIMVLVLYRLLADKNPRFFPSENREKSKVYQRANLFVFVLTL
jgi:hypothetical protein